MTTTAVIGGTGKVGRHIIAGITADGGQRVRALARSAKSTQCLSRLARVTVVHADLDEPASLPAALEGVDRLLIVTPYDVRQGERECAAVDAAEAAGVQRVVKISSYSAGIEPEVPVSRGHKMAERALRDSTMEWTILRPDWWFDSLLLQIDALRAGTFSFPAHGARVTAIDARDLAEVAVRELTAARSYGGVITLTGPTTFGFGEIAARLSVAIGSPLTFVDDVSSSWPPSYAAAMTALFEHYRRRGDAPYSHAIAELLGCRPRSVDDFGRDVLRPLLKRAH